MNNQFSTKGPIYAELMSKETSAIRLVDLRKRQEDMLKKAMEDRRRLEESRIRGSFSHNDPLSRRKKK